MFLSYFQELPWHSLPVPTVNQLDWTTNRELNVLCKMNTNTPGSSWFILSLRRQIQSLFSHLSWDLGRAAWSLGSPLMCRPKVNRNRNWCLGSLCLSVCMKQVILHIMCDKCVNWCEIDKLMGPLGLGPLGPCLEMPPRYRGELLERLKSIEVLGHTFVACRTSGWRLILLWVFAESMIAILSCLDQVHAEFMT